ncbi:hypothetical protein Efla_006512 [Eimeria flavescens]
MGVLCTAGGLRGMCHLRLRRRPSLLLLLLLVGFLCCWRPPGRLAVPWGPGGALSLTLTGRPQPILLTIYRQQQQQQHQQKRPHFAALRCTTSVLRAFPHSIRSSSSNSSSSTSSSSSSMLQAGFAAKGARKNNSWEAHGRLCRVVLPLAASALLLALLVPLRLWSLAALAAFKKQSNSSNSSGSSSSSNSKSNSNNKGNRSSNSSRTIRSSSTDSHPMEKAEASAPARAFALRHLLLRAGAATARKPPADWAPIVFRLEGLPLALRARQSPGDGNCLFVSVAAALWPVSFESHVSFASEELREAAASLRTLAVDTLQDASVSGFVLEGPEGVGRQQLLQLVAQQYGCSPAEYCSRMRLPSTWGGGPEIVALSHALSRPIAVYTLHQAQGGAPPAASAAATPDAQQRVLQRLLLQPQQQQQQQQEEGEAALRLCKVFGWREGCEEEPLHLLFVNAGGLLKAADLGAPANHFVPLHPQPPP